jgi:hypothetical protein
MFCCYQLYVSVQFFYYSLSVQYILSGCFFVTVVLHLLVYQFIVYIFIYHCLNYLSAVCGQIKSSIRSGKKQYNANDKSPTNQS